MPLSSNPITVPSKNQVSQLSHEQVMVSPWTFHRQNTGYPQTYHRQETGRYGLAADSRSAHTRTWNGLRTGCSRGATALTRPLNQRNHAIPTTGLLRTSDGRATGYTRTSYGQETDGQRIRRRYLTFSPLISSHLRIGLPSGRPPIRFLLKTAQPRRVTSDSRALRGSSPW